MERILDLSKKYKIAFGFLIIVAIGVLFLTNNKGIEESYKQLAWAIFAGSLTYTLGKIIIEYYAGVSYQELKESVERNNAQQEELIRYQIKLKDITERFEENTLLYIGINKDIQNTLIKIEKAQKEASDENKKISERINTVEDSIGEIRTEVDRIARLAKVNAEAISRQNKSHTRKKA